MPAAMVQKKVLGIVAAANGNIRIGEVVESSGLKKKAVQEAVTRLKDKKAISGKSKGTHSSLKITEAGQRLTGKPLAIRVPQKNNPLNTLRSRVWRALRMKRRSTIKDLLRVCTEEGSKPSDIANVGTYFRYLARAGILSRALEPGKSGYSWILRKDLGPKNPQLHKNHEAVTDPNNGEVFLVEKNLDENYWRGLLVAAINKQGSKSVVAARLGISRTVVARVLNGTYCGRVDLVAGKVIAAFGGKDV